MGDGNQVLTSVGLLNGSVLTREKAAISDPKPVLHKIACLYLKKIYFYFFQS